MKTTLFLLLFFCLAFACGSPEDFYILKTGDTYKIILTKYGGDEFTDSIFNKNYPQYADKAKKTYWGNDIFSIIDMGEKYSSNPALLRKVVIVE